MTTTATIAFGAASPSLSGDLVYEVPASIEVVAAAPATTPKFWLSAEGGLSDIVMTNSYGNTGSVDDYCYYDDCTVTSGMNLAFEAGMYIGNGCKTRSNNGPQKRLHIAVVAE